MEQADSILQEHLTACRLCPRACGVDRLSGRRGWCGAGALARVARVALHHWEEPVISGSRGSGTVFFSRCNLRCLYCQNHEISRGGAGRELGPADLVKAFLDLQDQGAHNINLVSPTPYIPQIAAALRLARREGLVLPVVYNTNSYETPDALRCLASLVQIFLPDLKYADEGLAKEYSKAKGYVAVATAAIRTMRELAPADRFADGVMTDGLLVRHLVLPGHSGNTEKVLHWIGAELGPETQVSLMSQYTPVFHARTHPLLGRRLFAREYERALSDLEEAGLRNGFCQTLDSASMAYIPEFDPVDPPS